MNSYLPCRCLCLGLVLQMTRSTPRRRTILQLRQSLLMLLRTFIFFSGPFRLFACDGRPDR